MKTIHESIAQEMVQILKNLSHSEWGYAEQPNPQWSPEEQVRALLEAYVVWDEDVRLSTDIVFEHVFKKISDPKEFLYYLSRFLKDSNETVRQGALWFLNTLHHVYEIPADISWFMEGLNDPAPAVRGWAAFILGTSFRENAAEIIPVLKKSLRKEKIAEVQDQIFTGLHYLISEQTISSFLDMQNYLIDLLKKEASAGVREGAVGLLGKIAQFSPSSRSKIKEALLYALKDSSWRIRERAQQWLKDL